MPSYTMILSRGTHVISSEAADSVSAALAEREPFVVIDVDFLSDGFMRKNVKIATAHVIALMPNEGQEDEFDDSRVSGNVTPLRSVR